MLSWPAWFRTTAVLAGVALAACGREPSAGTGMTVVDDAGDTLHLARPASRIVSLVPATTELLFAVGAGPQLVGRTHWCDYPEAARAVPDLGDGLNPNIEAVVGARPDLVVLYRSGTNARAAERFRALGIPALQLTVDRLADVPRLARLLGRVSGHPAVGDSVADRFERDLAAATVPPPARRTSVLIVAWDQPPMAIGAGSFLSEMVDRAGGRNIFDDLEAPSAQISIEAAVARDPDVLLVSSDGPPALASRPEWRTVPAVRESRFVRVTSSAFSRPSPRAPAAIAELAQRLRDARP